MAQRFRGEFELKVDAKGRVSIPATFRRVLELGDPSWSDGKRANFVVVYGMETQCWLECYTLTAIQEIEERLDMLQDGTEDQEELIYKFNSYVLDMQIDDDGRIVLPQKMRDKLELDGDEKALFISKGKHFEIWKKDKFEALKLEPVRARLAERGPAYNPIVKLPQKPVT